MAVPGPIGSPMSGGCHDLIRIGAHLVTCVDEVLDVVGSSSDVASAAEAEPVELDASPLDALDPLSRRVFDGLPARRAAGIDEISLTSGVPAADVLRSLPVLEMCGAVEAGPEGYRIARKQDRGGRGALT